MKLTLYLGYKMYSNDSKKYILNGILSDIWNISHLDYQERIWIRGEGPECDSYDDTVCEFFQNIEGILKDYKSFNISESQYYLLLNFKEKFEFFCDGPGADYYLPQIFIYKPEWMLVMNEAKKVLIAFNYLNKIQFSSFKENKPDN